MNLEYHFNKILSKTYKFLDYTKDYLLNNEIFEQKSADKIEYY